MERRKIKVICRSSNEELSEGYTKALSTIIFESDLKHYTYKQVERVIQRLNDTFKGVGA